MRLVICSSSFKLFFSDIKIFPNPSSNTFNINTTLSIDKIELYDSLGQLVKEQENTTRVETQYLKSGMYFLKIYSEARSYKVYCFEKHAFYERSFYF